MFPQLHTHKSHIQKSILPCICELISLYPLALSLSLTATMNLLQKKKEKGRVHTWIKIIYLASQQQPLYRNLNKTNNCFATLPISEQLIVQQAGGSEDISEGHSATLQPSHSGLARNQQHRPTLIPVVFVHFKITRPVIKLALFAHSVLYSCHLISKDVHPSKLLEPIFKRQPQDKSILHLLTQQHSREVYVQGQS